jgi:hypothetical protein
MRASLATTRYWHICLIDHECWGFWWRYGMPIRVHWGKRKQHMVTVIGFHPKCLIGKHKIVEWRKVRTGETGLACLYCAKKG